MWWNGLDTQTDVGEMHEAPDVTRMHRFASERAVQRGVKSRGTHGKRSPPRLIVWFDCRCDADD